MSIVVGCGMEYAGNNDLNSFMHHDYDNFDDWKNENNPNFILALKSSLDNIPLEDQLIVFRKMIVWGRFLSYTHNEIVSDLFVEFIEDNPSMILYDGKFEHPICCERSQQSGIKYLTNQIDDVEKVKRIIKLVKTNFDYFISSIKKLPTFSFGNYNIIENDNNVNLYNNEERDEYKKCENYFMLFYTESLEKQYYEFRKVLSSFETCEPIYYKAVCIQFMDFIFGNRKIMFYDNMFNTPIAEEIDEKFKITDFSVNKNAKRNYDYFCFVMASIGKISILTNKDKYGCEWSSRIRA
jgi:hypothetical protein